MEKKSVLLATIVLMMLPGLTFGVVATLCPDLTSAPGGAVVGNTVTYADPASVGQICFDALLSSDTAFDGVQFCVSVSELACGDENGNWQSTAAPWTMPGPGAPGSAGFAYLPSGMPGVPPYLNDYVTGIGDGNKYPQPGGGGDGNPDHPSTLLSALLEPELYFKGSGQSLIGTGMLVGSYCIEPAAALNPGVYEISLTCDTMGFGVEWFFGEHDKGPFGDGGPDCDITVVVEPEPMSALLLIAGLPFLRRRR